MLGDGVLNFQASAPSGTGFAPFAFNSITISASFSGTGTSQILGIDSPGEPGFPFGTLYGGFSLSDTSFTIPGDVDLGSLVTLEPLPSGAAPDVSSTLTLAGLGFAGLVLFGRRRLPANA